MNAQIHHSEIACIGSGVIGAGWIARFLENGFNVNIYDPDPKAEESE